jgi:hypothetical protein
VRLQEIICLSRPWLLQYFMRMAVYLDVTISVTITESVANVPLTAILSIIEDYFQVFQKVFQ